MSTKHNRANVVPSTRAGRREWFGLAIIALPCILYSMDFTVLHLAVPKLTAALQPSSTELLWIVDIYGFLLAGALITMGVLGDRVGRRKLLLIVRGMLAFSKKTLGEFLSVPKNELVRAPWLSGLPTLKPRVLLPNSLTHTTNASRSTRSPRPA